jgi:hypothetical protein
LISAQPGGHPPSTTSIQLFETRLRGAAFDKVLPPVFDNDFSRRFGALSFGTMVQILREGVKLRSSSNMLQFLLIQVVLILQLGAHASRNRRSRNLKVIV